MTYPTFDTPPCTHRRDGGERRVGVELEFTGLRIERIAQILRDTLGGAIEPHSAYEYDLNGTVLGDFRIELDYAYLKRLGRRQDAPGELEQLSEDMLAAVAKQVVPFEVVAPPAPISRLHELTPLVAALRAAGARGTADSPLYGFGLHLNIELPNLEATTLRDYLRAYAILHDWLFKVSAVDLSRRIFPYIQPYPRDYVRRILAPDYEPDIAGLAEDYLAANASRNRSLDLLPLLAYLDEARVRDAVGDSRISARPALHYRLPNCEIERPDWNLDRPWRHWLAVERLASDASRLSQACEAYRAHLANPVADLLGSWADTAGRWIDAPPSAASNKR